MTDGKIQCARDRDENRSRCWWTVWEVKDEQDGGDGASLDLRFVIVDSRDMKGSKVTR